MNPIDIDDVSGVLRAHFANRLHIKLDQVVLTPDTDLEKDLGFETLDCVELAMALEDRLGLAIQDDAYWPLKRLGDIVALLQNAVSVADNQVFEEQRTTVPGMTGYTRHRLTLERLMAFWGASFNSVEFITTDAHVEREYAIVRQQSSDGTHALTYAFMQESMQSLFDYSSYHRGKEPLNEDGSITLPPGHYRHYTIGHVWLLTAFGKDYCRGRWPGQKERIYIPVRTEIRPIPKKFLPSLEKQT